jgi:signal transduction histidine kinase
MKSVPNILQREDDPNQAGRAHPSRLARGGVGEAPPLGERQGLQALATRLLESQESESRTIARLLHDEIGQGLIVMQLHTQWMLQASESGALTPRLMENLQVVEQLLEQVHAVSLNLRPAVLDDLGVEAAIHWCAERQASLIGLRAGFYADPIGQRLDPMVETACFRVAQEALSNVVRHAQAKSLSVELRKGRGLLHLRVSDDGMGFDIASAHEKAMRGASLGLLNMEARAEWVGGGLEISSTSSKGTEVHAWFPVAWQTPRSKLENA